MQVPVEGSITELGRSIQMAIAPVFLLSGVAAFLNVLHARLLRVIDRTRFLEGIETNDSIEHELDILVQRRHWINRSITLCTLCALLICFVVSLLFVGAVIHFELTKLVVGLFIAAMAALIGALLSFLREVHMAVRHFRRSASPR